MIIGMYAVHVRFVRDSRGRLHSRSVVITVARSHVEAASNARAKFTDLESAGVVVEYGAPSQLADTIELESMSYAGEPLW